MNVSDFTHFLQHPDKVVSPVHAKQLQDVLDEYPYFQAARALHLKGLKNLNSFKYNNALKTTAAYTADRDVLFEFITSDDFVQNTIADSISGRATPLVDQEIVSEEVKAERSVGPLIEATEDGPLPRTAEDAEHILDPALFASKDPAIDHDLAQQREEAERELEIGEPLPFTKREKHSFSEWLQLTSFKSLRRGAKDSKGSEMEEIDFPLDENPDKKKKFELIDKFIETNPKMVPKEPGTVEVNIKDSLKIDKNELMTETLAKVYLEQRKYKKAIQAYKILSLKYPEKSGFFADRIKAIEKLRAQGSEQ